jgi:beta-lactamase class A
VQRRTFILVSGLAASAGFQMPELARAGAMDRLSDLERQVGGRIGVSAVDTRNGTRMAHRSDERFAMCSTFKWLLAAAVLAEADRDAGLLDRTLTVAPKDLLEVSPVTAKHVGLQLTIRTLCEAAVQLSDNTAANMLLEFIGGPSSLTQFLRRVGDSTTRLDRNEPTLNSNLPGDVRDTTTPDAMLATMRLLVLGSVLSDDSRDTLIDWLKKCTTGLDRIRAGLPPTWQAGDKTGTGVRGAVNDVAFAWPPTRAPILIAVYMSDSRASVEALSAAHARIGAMVAAAFS